MEIFDHIPFQYSAMRTTTDSTIQSNTVCFGKLLCPGTDPPISPVLLYGRLLINYGFFFNYQYLTLPSLSLMLPLPLLLWFTVFALSFGT